MTRCASSQSTLPSQRHLDPSAGGLFVALNAALGAWTQSLPPRGGQRRGLVYTGDPILRRWRGAQPIALSFSEVPAEQIEVGVQRLSSVIEAALQSGRRLRSAERQEGPPLV